ncbi:MAG: hypothetical protein HY851_03295 [candidate division Zixibacteria bacterium]|nr:hypothetical protein [candidate division Zixibacteria bacterium]
MKRYWTLLASLVALSIMLAWVASCRKDIYVEPPPSIVGKYKGTYCYSEDDNNELTADVDTCQYVKVTFTADTWLMYLDENKTAAADRMACDCNGDYTLENGVQLVLVDSNSTNKVCTYTWLPSGSFLLIQDEADTLCPVVLRQSLKDNIRNITVSKEFCLKPASF